MSAIGRGNILAAQHPCVIVPLQFRAFNLRVVWATNIDLRVLTHGLKYEKEGRIRCLPHGQKDPTQQSARTDRKLERCMV